MIMKFISEKQIRVSFKIFILHFVNKDNFNNEKVTIGLNFNFLILNQNAISVFIRHGWFDS